MHYALETVLDPAHGALASRVTITIPAARAKDGADFLLGPGYAVASVSADHGAEAKSGPTDKPFPGLTGISVRAAAGDAHDVHLFVAYSGPLFIGNDPPVNEISPQRIELSADALWYPLSTDFNERFTLDAKVRGLGADFVIASPDRVEMRAAGFDLFRKRPSTDIAFSGAPNLKVADYGALQFIGRDLDSDQAKQFRINGPKALAFEAKWLGPLPSGKSVVAIVERKSGVGYSRPGYIVVSDVGLKYEPKNLWSNAGYLAHEISHAWWSNASFTGEDYWLVESTAEYTALRFLQAEFGDTAIDDILAKKQPRADKGGPILGHGRASGDAVYAKGPLLLFALEKKIGRDKLDRLLTQMAKQETLTTKDFLDALSRSAGLQAAQDFAADLRR